MHAKQLLYTELHPKPGPFLSIHAVFCCSQFPLPVCTISKPFLLSCWVSALATLLDLYDRSMCILQDAFTHVNFPWSHPIALGTFPLKLQVEQDEGYPICFPMMVLSVVGRTLLCSAFNEECSLQGPLKI